MSFWQFISSNYKEIQQLIIEHIRLTSISVALAIAIGIPLGVLITYIKKLSKPIISTANILQAIPSMALLGFLIPFMGIGTVPAVVAVVLYSLLPIIKNTYIGINNINPETLEAAKGIGLTKFQVLAKVQIPLALPVIMAGIRIASVTAVGLMTMAAFIGAGGLGQLVFAGIRTVNNNQILAGAIPACLLALAVDGLIGIFEKLVTPVSLQKGDNTNIRKNRAIYKWILGVTAASLAVLMIISSSSNSGNQKNTITIGSKDYTEQILLGNLVAYLIEENTDIAVNREFDLGGTKVCFGALQGGDIDLYVEYAGTAYSDILKYPPISDMNIVYSTIKNEYKEKYNIEVLKSMKFNNTYALAVTEETAKKYNLKTVSDFAKVADKMTSGTTFEFSNREDGLPGLEKYYQFKMGRKLSVDSGPRYTAIEDGEVDVIDAFTTDGLLKKFKLVTLEDDKNFFPPYYTIPIIRSEVLEECTEIVPLFEQLGSILTDDIMIDLNYQIDVLQKSPSEVAYNFLIEQGLIK